MDIELDTNTGLYVVTIEGEDPIKLDLSDIERLYFVLSCFLADLAIAKGKYTVYKDLTENNHREGLG